MKQPCRLQLPSDVADRLAAVWTDILVADYYARHTGERREVPDRPSHYDAHVNHIRPCHH